MSAPTPPTTTGASASASQKLPVAAIEREPGIGAEHVEGAMGQVDDVEHAEDQRQPDREEEEQDSVGEPVQRLAEEVGHEGHAPLRLSADINYAAAFVDPQAGKVQPVPGSLTSATLSIGTLLMPPATSLTSRM